MQGHQKPGTGAQGATEADSWCLKLKDFVTFEPEDNLPGFRPISPCFSEYQLLSPEQFSCWTQSYYLGRRWALFIKSSPAVEADSGLHHSCIQKILFLSQTGTKVNFTMKGLYYHRSSTPGTLQNLPTPLFSIFLLLNLSLRLTIVDHFFSD